MAAIIPARCRAVSSGAAWTGRPRPAPPPDGAGQVVRWGVGALPGPVPRDPDPRRAAPPPERADEDGTMERPDRHERKVPEAARMHPERREERRGGDKRGAWCDEDGRTRDEDDAVVAATCMGQT